ncbi:hypothetical protein GQ54DRAFT_261227 [Martensiomyces pterosporus]|nr:hypothetical protein GQ54DRAFT_261227 [Martensiomyces pterosporus]
MLRSVLGASSASLRTVSTPRHRACALLVRQNTTRCLHQTRLVQSIPGFDSNNPTLRKIQSNPRVMSAMIGAMQTMQSKGFVDPSNPRPPSFMKLMQMMSDPDIKKKFVEVQQVLKEEGISFSSAELSAFMNAGGMAQDAASEQANGGFKTKEQAEVGETSSVAGEDKKGGLFKRLSSSFKARS